MYALIPTSSLCVSVQFFPDIFFSSFFLGGGWNIYWPASHRVCVEYEMRMVKWGKKLEHDTNVSGARASNHYETFGFVDTQSIQSLYQIKGFEAIKSNISVESGSRMCFWHSFYYFSHNNNLCIVQLVHIYSHPIIWVHRLVHPLQTITNLGFFFVIWRNSSALCRGSIHIF